MCIIGSGWTSILRSIEHYHGLRAGKKCSLKKGTIYQDPEEISLTKVRYLEG